jgi:rhamnosyltransferase
MDYNLELKKGIPKVAAIVILYNPDQYIIENIKSYIYQVSELFIIDNSENPNRSIKEFSDSIEQSEYIFNNANLGVATALNLGAESAISKSCSYLLTMDQDSKAPENLVESLLNQVSSLENIGLISPLHSNVFDTHKKLQNTGVSKVNTIMTSGNLLSLEAYKKVGGFKESYFIDYVDVEYCLKLLSNEYNVYRLNNVVLEHNEANLSEMKIFNFKFYPTNNAPLRLYYKTRNLLYLRNNYKKKYPKQIKEEFSIYFKNVIKILLFEQSKWLKIKMIVLGIIDYIKKKQGRKF